MHFQDRKLLMGVTHMRTPQHRGMVDLSGNLSGQAGLLGEARQKKGFVEVSEVWV